MNRGAGQMWPPNANGASGNGTWNSQQVPFSPRPPFSVPPPPTRPCGSSAWLSRPPPPFCVPPPSFSGPPPSGPPPPFSCPPPPFSVPPPQFTAPPPQFSGPPPSFGGQSSQNTAPPSWNSRQTSASRQPWSGSGGGQSGAKRSVNNVWSDQSLLSSSQRTFDGQRNRNGNPHHSRGQQGGRGGRGRGRGRGNHQFQQERDGKNKGDGLWNNNSSSNNNNHNNNNNRSNRGKKKEKVDKRDLPDNNQYHCEVCDRGFKTEEKYEEHVSQHAQCWVAGCRYVAAPKLVELHYNAQHKTGVAKKIWSLDSPEAIKKWIEDRKRNYPTKENIARKQKERAERRARGEVIENKQFGKMRGRGRGRGQRGHHHRGRGRHGFQDRRWEDSDEQTLEGNVSQPDHSTHTQDGQQTQDSSLTTSSVNGKEGCSQDNAVPEPKAKKRKLDKDEGGESTKEKGGDSRDPLSLLINEDGDSDDGDDTVPVQSWGEGLKSLIASYDDSAKEDGELSDDEESSTAVEPNISLDSAAREENGEMNEQPDDVITAVRRTTREEPSWIRHNKRRRDQKYWNNTLLERLLVNEIRHERNVLLQCVHYIVKNDFLGVGAPTAETAGK